MAKDGNKTEPRLLTGGNPQIAKGYGAAPVQAWIAAAPGWKRDAAAEIDALVRATLPDVRMAVKWNSPLYGRGDEPQDYWFMGLHATAGYLKVAFFRGRSLTPMPPVASKRPEVRYLHVGPDAPLDHAQFTDWLAQAARLPGEKM